MQKFVNVMLTDLGETTDRVQKIKTGGYQQSVHV